MAAFFGRRRPAISRLGDAVAYQGPDEWSYRRFVLHYAHLCALAGGVDAFCIGSEMRGLTQIRDGADGYPAVRAAALAEEVRAVLGPGREDRLRGRLVGVLRASAGDGSGDVLFHLDPLWASPAIDFVGIDNYMPLPTGATGRAADAAARVDLRPRYLGNVAGGEGFDWYYADAEGARRRSRTADHRRGLRRAWVFRYKDLVELVVEPHVNRWAA